MENKPTFLMKTFTLDKQLTTSLVFSVLGLFFIISSIALAEQKITGLSPFDSKEIYTSPDGKFQAITVQKNEEVIQTYITDDFGRMIVEPQTGSFVSWYPDSSKVVLFLSAIQNPKGRELYLLGTDGSYVNSGLPVGVISADYSVSNSDIVYSLTQKGTDNSDIYVRIPSGQDQLILRGDNNILTWLRWSSQDSKIIYMQSDLLIRPGKQYLWIMDSDGNNKEKISPVDWDYPAAWSPDGSSIAFANAGDIWEYRIKDKSLTRLTNQGMYETAINPEYSPDGKTISYSLKTNITGNRLSVASLPQTEIKDLISNPNIPVTEMVSSSTEDQTLNEEAITSSTTEDQSINL